MSTAIMQQSALYDFGDLLLKNSDVVATLLQLKNQSRPAVQSQTSMPSGWEHGALARAASLPRQTLAGLLDRLQHRRLERTTSEPAPPPASRYKTELCRPFEEAGACKYGDKCQFAHGARELRNLQRHPKYKTELCRTFHSVGFCPYGPRCHFVHNAEEARRREPPSPGGSVGSLGSAASAASLASYLSGERSPPALSPAFARIPRSPSPPAAHPAAPPSPSDEARLPVFNRISATVAAFGDLTLV